MPCKLIPIAVVLLSLLPSACLVDAAAVDRKPGAGDGHAVLVGPNGQKHLRRDLGHYSYEYPKSGKGRGKESLRGKDGKGYDYYAHSYYYDNDDHEAKTCAAIIDGTWTYTTADASSQQVDVDGSQTVSMGDVNFVSGGELSVASSLDGSVIIATGTVDGKCTVTPTVSARRDFCVLTYRFGDLGSMTVQGPLEKLTVTGVTGCFYNYYGIVEGYNIGTEWGFTVEAYVR